MAVMGRVWGGLQGARLAALTVCIGCGGDDDPDPTGATAASSSGSDAGTTVGTTTNGGTTTTTSGGESGGSSGSSGGSGTAAELEVRFFGVGGVSLRHGDDQLLTAPLFTNPSIIDVNLGQIAPDPAIIDQFLDPAFVADTRAIVVGHAHYDHLMDVPYVWTKTADARIYGNVSMRHILAGFPEVPSDRVVALNDPADPLVDRRMCETDGPCTGIPADTAGSWIAVPNSNIRIRGLCSLHPPQFLGVIHFGEGCVTADTIPPPPGGADWLEGATMAYLIDFLDDAGQPEFRVYYQDAPTDAPIGHVHPDVLVEKRVDLAILNIGTYDAVRDQPGEIIAHLEPRYALGVHWENFFQTQDQPLAPIPFHPAPEVFDDGANAAMPDPADAPVLVDGAQAQARYYRPNPGTDFVFEAEPR